MLDASVTLAAARLQVGFLIWGQAVLGTITHRGPPPEDELSDHVWMALDEARSLDLPPITRVVLEDLGDRLKLGPLDGADAPVPYYFHRNGTFKREMIGLNDQVPQSPSDD